MGERLKDRKAIVVGAARGIGAGIAERFLEEGAPDKSDADLQKDWQSPRSAVADTKIESTVRYLGIEVDDALAIAEQVEV